MSSNSRTFLFNPLQFPLMLSYFNELTTRRVCIDFWASKIVGLLFALPC